MNEDVEGRLWPHGCSYKRREEVLVKRWLVQKKEEMILAVDFFQRTGRLQST